jgi:tRNA-Thr(GGU) m(6)t(6)A37 methyltransferase TsaA
MIVEPIGIIHGPFRTKDDCPIQPAFASNAPGRIEVFPQFAQGLQDIEGFSHIYLIYWLDRAGEVKLVRPTFLDDREHGVFASRHPCRPNPLGLSIVRLAGRRENILDVEGIDVLDQTPLLDIKPYVPKFDRIDQAAEGWTAGLDWRPKPKGRE